MMAPFKNPGAQTYKGRVYDPDSHASVIRSYGTRNEAEAGEVRGFMRRLKQTRQWDALRLIVAKKLKPIAAYDASHHGTLQALVAGLKAEQADIDLSPLVDEWKETARSQTYVRQVRELVIEGERFPRSEFTRGRCSKFLAGLKVSGSTRNRYRVALSQFARWLVERDVVPTNPLREVRGYTPNPSRMVYYTRDEATRLLWALPQPYRCLEALMCGTGMEWAACAMLEARDFEPLLNAVHARGTKNRWRNRMVKITEAWVLPMIREHTKALAPTDRLFTFSNKMAWDQHRKAVKAANLPASTLHDWRHTYAVQAIRDGMPDAAIKRQLGHAPNSNQLRTVYGVYFPTEADYRTAQTPESATETATSTQKARRA